MANFLAISKRQANRKKTLLTETQIKVWEEKNALAIFLVIYICVIFVPVFMVTPVPCQCLHALSCQYY